MKIYSEKLKKGQFETWSSKPEFAIHHVTQVHGTDIISPETLPCEADGIFVSWEKIDRPLAIKTADCLPIVIEGETGVVFLHAGWRGLAGGILNRPEIEMIKPLSIFIGPSIQHCCFEVTPEFKSHFPQSSHFEIRGDKLFFNLQQEAVTLFKSKFSSVTQFISPSCTCCDEHFNSYRRNKTSERNWNIYKKDHSNGN